MQKRRAVMFVLLMVLGVGMLAYGFHSQSGVVSSGGQSQGEQAQVTPTSGPAVTQADTPAVALGEAKPAESGQIKKATEQSQKAPAACPT